jgi:hypothetical protein
METAAPIQQEERRNEDHKVQINSSAPCSSLVHQIIHQKDARREGKKTQNADRRKQSDIFIRAEKSTPSETKVAGAAHFSLVQKENGKCKRRKEEEKTEKAEVILLHWQGKKNIGLQEALTMIKDDTGDEAPALQAPRSLQQKLSREEKASANRCEGEAGFWREAQGPGGCRFPP